MIDGGGEALRFGQADDDMTRVFPEDGMGGIVFAAVVNNDDFVGLRIAQPKGGKTPQGAFTGLVGGDDDGNCGSSLHSSPGFVVG